MNQAEIKRWVKRLVANSLRKEAPHLTSGKLGAKANQKDVTKARAEMLALAQKLDPTEDTSATATGQPVPQGGQDDIPKDRDGAAEGEPSAPAGEHKP